MLIFYGCFFLVGIIIGSFLNVCIYRIPRGESIVNPPSHCTKCRRGLKPLDLVPVFSFIFLKAKCRYCAAKISIRYPLIELLTGIVFVGLFYKYGLTVDFAAFAFLMSILIAVFFIDMDHQIIPDGLVIAGLIGGILLMAYNLFQPFLIYGDRYWWNPLAGMGIGVGFLLFVALLGMWIYKSEEVMGMGDVKIFAPIGLFLGWKMCGLALLIAILLGGIIGLLLILFRLKDRKSTIPFGPFIVTGAFISILWGWDIIYWYISCL